MRLKKGKDTYKLPKDFCNLASVSVKNGLYSEIIREYRGARSSAEGLPNSFNVFMNIDGWYISFHPTPKKAYYVDIDYFKLGRI